MYFISRKIINNKNLREDLMLARLLCLYKAHYELERLLFRKSTQKNTYKFFIENEWTW
jgi:hypothetical protein